MSVSARWWSAAVTLSLLVGVSLAVAPAATAAPPPSSLYIGQMSDGGEVTIEISPDATRVYFTFRYGGTQPPGCALGYAATDPLSGNSVAYRGDTTATQTNLRYTAFCDTRSYRWAVGTLSVDPVAGLNCPSRRLTWTAVRDAAAVATVRPLPGTYTGPVYGAGYEPAAGLAQVIVSNDGTTVSSFNIAYQGGGCTWGVQSSLPAPAVRDNVWWGSTGGTGQDMSSVVAVSGAIQFAGAFTLPSSSPSCPAVAGVFVVTLAPGGGAPTPTPAATATPPPGPTPAAGATGRIVSGAIPLAGGIGLVVFGGGTSTQLVSASGCPVATAAFWATDAAGTFVAYVPGTSIGVVNEAWNARFPTGIPVNTPLLGRCA